MPCCLVGKCDDGSRYSVQEEDHEFAPWDDPFKNEPVVASDNCRDKGEDDCDVWVQPRILPEQDTKHWLGKGVRGTNMALEILACEGGHGTRPINSYPVFVSTRRSC